MAKQPAHTVLCGNTDLTFEADTQTGKYTLTVQYYSKLPPQEHDKIHARLWEAANQFMIGRGLDPAKGSVVIKHDNQVRAEQSENCEESLEQRLARQHAHRPADQTVRE